MIHLFRRIRQGLLSQNRFSKYMLYAIGEIVLVVIGILIALQINNWNERKKEEVIVFNYLANLKDALANDITSLENTISFNKTRLKGIFYILKYAGLNTKTFTEMEWIDISENDNISHIWRGPYPDSLNRKFTDLAFTIIGRGFGAASFNKSIINELYATGSFSNIPNANLKEKISDYYRYLDQRLEGYAIEEHEQWANETTRFLRDEYGIFTLDVSDLDNPIELLKNEKDAEHQLRYLALEVNYHCIWSTNAKNMAVELVELIENEELKKTK